MSEIAKCPLCSKDVKKSIWRPGYEGCAGSVIITVKCCGMEALTVELWNRYAAAPELYAALERIYGRLLMSDRDGECRITEEDGAMADAALRKARGEE